MLDSSCNPISFGYDAHNPVVVHRYSCIHEDVCHHVVNLAFEAYTHGNGDIMLVF